MEQIKIQEAKVKESENALKMAEAAFKKAQKDIIEWKHSAKISEIKTKNLEKENQDKKIKMEGQEKKIEKA